MKTLPKAQRTRGLSSYHKFLHKTWSTFVFRISTKHQLQNPNQTSASPQNLNFKILTKPIFLISTISTGSPWAEQLRAAYQLRNEEKSWVSKHSRILFFSLFWDNSVENIFYSLSQCVCVGSATAAPPPTHSTLCGHLLSLRLTKIQLHNLN